MGHGVNLLQGHPSKPQQGSRDLLVSVDKQGVGLVDARERDAGDIYMRGPGNSPQNYIRNIFCDQRDEAGVDLGGTALVAVKAHYRMNSVSTRPGSMQ